MRAVEKRFGEFQAVAGVDLAVASGEIVGLVGPNGSGKTTTIECLLGLRRPDSGDVCLDGYNPAIHPIIARRRVGAQIQPCALQEKITPREAMAFHAAFFPSPAPVAEILSRLGLMDKADARYDTLSFGQKQRLALALALVNRPALLVLDEPTAGLDPKTRDELHAILVEHRAAGGGCLLSTHDLHEAQRLCDRVVVLHRGRVAACDTPARLIAAAGLATRIVCRTAHPQSLSGEVEATDGLRHHFHTTEPARSIAAIGAAVHQAGNELTALEMIPPSLEDAFTALTGDKWDGAEDR
jgi:ABC-2 type transport system ATP-binding protein